MNKVVSLDINILFSVIGVIIVGLLTLVFYLIKLKIADIDKKRDKETCDKIHGPIDETLAEMREFMLARRFSPRDFSEHAKAIFVQSRLQDFIDERIDELFKKIDEMRPENVYDAEVMAEKVMRQFEEEEAIKTGAERADVSIETILFVGAIYLGKKYIEKHSELPEELNETKI